MSDPCQCKVCVTGRRLHDIRSKLNNEDSEFLKELGEELAAASTDAEYYKSIFDGTWPDSVAILERTLERAKIEQAKVDSR